MIGIEDPGLYRDQDRGEGQRVQHVRQTHLIKGLGIKVWGLRFRVQVSGFEV